jgi:hypothetical protein
MFRLWRSGWNRRGDDISQICGAWVSSVGPIRLFSTSEDAQQLILGSPDLNSVAILEDGNDCCPGGLGRILEDRPLSSVRV